MNEHVTQWLEAYFDREIPGRRARQIESHLETCPDCLAEFENLNRLSTLLQQAPEPSNLTPHKKFVAQVGLRLPRNPDQPGWPKALRIGWQWAPAGLLGVWVFMQTAFIVSGILMWVLRIVPGAADFASFVSAESQKSSLFGNVTNLSGAEWSEFGRLSLDFLRGGGPLGWGITIYLGLTFLISVLFLSWLASWWIQKTNGNQRSSR